MFLEGKMWQGMQLWTKYTNEKSLKRFLHLDYVLDFIIYLSIYLYGWIAGSWKAHFRNYRHYYVINVPSAPWTDYRISLTRHGLTQAKVHSLAKWIVASGNRTAIACVAIEVHDHYTTAPYLWLCEGVWDLKFNIRVLRIFKTWQTAEKVWRLIQ